MHVVKAGKASSPNPVRKHTPIQTVLPHVRLPACCISTGRDSSGASRGRGNDGGRGIKFTEMGVCGRRVKFLKD